MYALSRFGLQFETFLDLTPKQLFASIREKEKYDEQFVTYQVRMVCETLRTQTFHLLTSQGAKIRNVRKLMKFPWEKPEARPAQTAEQMKALMKTIAEGRIKSN